jgi:hypothetical protein
MQEFSKGVKYTTNYGMFKLDIRNRDVKKSKVDLIIEGVKRYGKIIQPITIDIQGVVIDGQHRLSAAQALGIEVPYVVSDGLFDPQQVLVMNTYGSQWTQKDHVKHFAVQGNPNYQKLSDLIDQVEENRMQISLRSLQALAQGHMGVDSRLGKHKMSIRSGGWKFNDDPEWCLRVLDQLKHVETLTPIIKGGRFLLCLSNLMQAQEGFDAKRLMDQINKFPEMINKTRNMLDCYRNIEDVYNYYKSHKNRLIFNYENL